MKIGFRLFWPSKNAEWRRAFKSKETAALFSDYLTRTSFFTSCEAKCVSDVTQYEKNCQRNALWLCERSAKKMLSSEEVAHQLERVAGSGISELHIAIGGPDGLREQAFKKIRPDLIWSFGPLTLPHELAAVIAAEQIYRACTILRKHPYHSGH